MSATKNLRKRPQVNYREEEGAPRKKAKTEKMEPDMEVVEKTVLTKQPIIAPNGKDFFACNYCSKIFSQKSTSLTHMKKCSMKYPNSSVNNIHVIEMNCNINSNGITHEVEKNENVEQLRGEIYIEQNCSKSNSESELLKEPKIKVSQNIAVKAAEPDKEAVNDSSIYDYNEQDDEKYESKELKENNNRICKICKMLFDNPLDLLRHTRDCHNFPRTILPPHEIEKYFDSPNREFCPICEKPIKTRNFRSVFIKHLLVHTTGLTHECTICKKKFRRRDHMRNHEKRHIVSV